MVSGIRAGSVGMRNLLSLSGGATRFGEGAGDAAGEMFFQESRKGIWGSSASLARLQHGERVVWLLELSAGGCTPHLYRSFDSGLGTTTTALCGQRFT